MSKPKRKYIEQDEFCVRLGIWGADLDPDEITRLLGASPTSAHRKGDVDPRDQSTKRSGYWSIKTERSTRDIEQQLTQLFAGLSSDPAVWNALTSRYDAELFCGVFLAWFGHGFSMTPNLHRLLADRNLIIIFDIYDEYDHDSEPKWETFEVEGESVTLQRIPRG
jgi:hypothetical protein